MSNATATAPTQQQVNKKDRLDLFGITMAPHKATKVLSKPMEGNHVGAVSLIVIHGGQYTAMNAYLKDGRFYLGSGYNPAAYTHPVSEKAKKNWVKKGYEEEPNVDTAKYPFLQKA